MASMFQSLLERFRRWRSPPLGSRGEALAAKFLKKLGHRIVARSAKELGGEIDLVTRDGKTWVFVEVKTRTNAEHGEPWQAVGANKARRMTQGARQFLHRRKIRDAAMRFDVVSIVWPEGGAGEPEVVHYSNAFHASEI